jgi:hypothetical protein
VENGGLRASPNPPYDLIIILPLDVGNRLHATHYHLSIYLPGVIVNNDNSGPVDYSGFGAVPFDLNIILVLYHKEIAIVMAEAEGLFSRLERDRRYVGRCCAATRQDDYRGVVPMWRWKFPHNLVLARCKFIDESNEPNTGDGDDNPGKERQQHAPFFHPQEPRWSDKT